MHGAKKSKIRMKIYEGGGQKKKKKKRLACHEKDELCKHEVCVSDRFMQQVCAQTFKGPRDNEGKILRHP